MNHIKITTRHKACPKPGHPIFLDGKKAISEQEGLPLALARLEWTDAKLAEMTGASTNTVRGWKIGRPLSVTALNVLRDALEDLEP